MCSLWNRPVKLFVIMCSVSSERKIPFRVCNRTVWFWHIIAYSIKLNTHKAMQLSLIHIWLLQDLCDENDKHKPFGVKTILLCSDFQQILPVVPHGSRATLIENFDFDVMVQVSWSTKVFVIWLVTWHLNLSLIHI